MRPPDAKQDSFFLYIQELFSLSLKTNTESIVNVCCRVLQLSVLFVEITLFFNLLQLCLHRRRIKKKKKSRDQSVSLIK